jgi:hypothetical protein
MTGRPDRQPNSGAIAYTEPTAIPDGMTVRVETLNLEFPAVGAAPTDISNWDCFDGALLAVVVQYGDRYVIEGTAVMIGLGLALSAKHVLEAHRNALMRGDAVLLCIGTRPNVGLDVWKCYAMSPEDGDGDLELLSLMLLSEWPTDGRFVVLPLTTRIPPVGETLTVAGFRFGEPGTVFSTDSIEPVGGLLYLSRGAAGEFSYPTHDWLPYPTIEVLSGSHGGMSGGAVFDVNGHVVGITSRGLSTADQGGPTWAAWWMSMYFWRPAPRKWPAGVAEEGVALSEMSTVSIVGREHVRVLDEPNFELTRYVSGARR